MIRGQVKMAWLKWGKRKSRPLWVVRDFIGSQTLEAWRLSVNSPVGAVRSEDCVSLLAKWGAEYCCRNARRRHLRREAGKAGRCRVDGRGGPTVKEED